MPTPTPEVTEEPNMAAANPMTESTAVPQSELLAHEQRYRAGAYSLLAALLRTCPDQAVLDQAAELSAVDGTRDELAVSMLMLGLAARDSAVAAVDDEYHALFIGLGRGELVPFASWYLTGFLMEKPLAVLRGDLRRLGYERSAHTHEPEDHAAALCEVMAGLIAEGRDLTSQADFFRAHMAPWLARFFADLSTAKSAVFYRAVGRFGSAFTELERAYLAMEV